MFSPQQVNIGRNSRYDIALPEPIANELRMLKAELEKSTKIEVKTDALCWMRSVSYTHLDVYKRQVTTLGKEGIFNALTILPSII